MADPGWAARTPEANDMLIKSGAGLPTMLTNGAAWTAVGAAHHASGIASAVNTALTSIGWIGAGSGSSVLNATMLNVALHGLAGWVDMKAPIVAAAVEAYQLAYGTMRTFQECDENRIESAFDNSINWSVLGALTPRIASLELEYFGMFWPNNSAVGAAYGATLNALTSSLTVPAPVAGMGASPAAPAAAASAVGEASAQTAAGGAMRAAYEGTSGATNAAGQGAGAAQGMGNQMSSMLGPVQQIGSTLMQAPQQFMQMPQQMMGPMQSMMGMFMNPSMLGGALNPAGAGGVPAAAMLTNATGAPTAGGFGGGGAGAPVSAFTRPVSAFESGGGRPQGLRPSGALGSVESQRVTTTSAGGMGGMPMAHGAGAGGKGQGSRPNERPNTVQVIDNRA
ncbi:PPE family protein [Mycolicibacter sp. MYC123]|uniref:PPE family protein n=1 Tax=[Mycobacterium] zoologicum TaxID=2872311 RepID=A0ABU5YLQ1_9MYCO|nr:MULTISPECIES: PPE family protein [unclassified Mycolicibacter]MEB3049904.1 PPE family protein [Mycolicibacter sp. MYC123]MEB3063234.1 PPE family protein [Mycolicibacter sp. MYC101]